MPCFFSLLDLDTKITIGELGTLIILFATFIVGTIYVIYTRMLWRESNFQSSIAISPSIVFQIADDDVLYVKNIGNGVAFNVIIDSFIYIIKDKNIKKRKIYKLNFETINLIESKESKEVKHDTILSNGSFSKVFSNDFSLVEHLNPKYQDEKNYLFTISYMNIIGKKYATKFYAGKDGIRIKRIYRLTILSKFTEFILSIVHKIRIFIRC